MAQVQPPEPQHALDLDSLLAYLYAPLLPHLKRATRRLGIARRTERRCNPRDILLPEGYTAEVVATGFTTPVHCSFDDQGFCYLVEGGHKVEARPRILKVELATGHSAPFFTWPAERWQKTGAVTGALWHDGWLYVTNTDTLSRISPEGQLEDLLTGLPGLGDHQTNYPVLGPDGKLYFGQGSATNAGVVGADNFAYEWLQHYPQFHDVPAQDVRLVARNYPFRDVLGSIRETVSSGAYVPFGNPTTADQVIEGDVKCTGAILRCNQDGSQFEVVAWGLRNPYGCAFHPDGRLFVTEHGIDERGARYIVGDPDDFYGIEPGAWYGWPDFAAGIRLDDPHWGDGGQGREPVLAEHPASVPPKPLLSFAPHAGANGVSVSPGGNFGFAGDAFVALFGDLAPVTTPRQAVPAGFKVVRVDLAHQRVVDFAVNKIAGPSSKLPHQGFERPSHCAFGPAGALYVVDWGEIAIALEAGGVRMVEGSGVLWRIRRTDEPAGERPREPLQLPLYPIQYLGLVGGLVGLGVALVLLARRRRARRSPAWSKAGVAKRVTLRLRRRPS